MKKLSEIASTAAQSRELAVSNGNVALKKDNSLQSSSEPLLKKAIDNAFARMVEAFPAAKYEIRTPELETKLKADFVEAMAFAGVGTAEQIKRGVVRACSSAVDGDRFLPSAGQFAQWCLEVMPEEVGMPGSESAYIEASGNFSATLHKWSHPGVMWAARAIGPTDWVLQHPKWTKKVFAAKYQEQVKKVASGESLPVTGLENKRPTPLTKQEREKSRESAKIHLAGLRKILG